MTTEPSPRIASDPAEFTAEWLTAALRAGGLEGRVRQVIDVAPVGTGQMASCYRISLDVDGDLPTSVVAKVPAPSANEMSANGYRNELAFYRLLAPHVRARIPRCHYGAIDESGLPFVLLLEDLAPATQGDQIAGCTADEADAAVRNLADAHGPLWDHDVLTSFDGAVPSDPSLLVQYMGWGTGEFVARYEDRLTARQVQLLQDFCAVVGGFKAHQPTDRSVQHGDYRLDNLLFRRDGDVPTCAVVDWQTACVGAPVHDLSYFVTTGLPVGQRRAHERSLVDAYRAGLRSHGVERAFDDVWRDYRFGQGHGVVITVLGAVVAERTARGDDMFMAMIERVCAALDDLDALDLYS
jgi:aminoglycoside/choline kinase family phosphotransferase